MNLKESFMELYKFLSLEDVKYIRENDGISGLSYLDCTYIDLIFFNKGCSPSFIADQLNIARSAVTVRLNTLENNGWIEKVKCDSDRRSVSLKLTEQSEKLFEPLYEIFSLFEKRIDESFSEDEKVLFTSMICKIIGPQ